MHKLFPVAIANDLQNTQCQEFVFFKDGRPRDGFLVKHDDAVFAYINRCPHQRRMLQWNPNVFLTKEKTHILCSVHGATFQIETGLCVGGPCVGASLEALTVKIENDVVLVSVPELV